MNNRLLSVLKYLLGWPFSILSFFFILNIILPRFSEISNNFHSVNFGLLFVGILSFTNYFFIRSYIWHLLIKKFAKDTKFKESAYLWANSEIKRYIPGSVVSLIGRTVAFSERGIKKKDVGKMMINEAVLFIFGAVIFSLISIPFVFTNFINRDMSVIQYLVYFSVVIGITVYVFFQKNFKIFQVYDFSENASHILLSTIANVFFGVANFFIIASFLTLPIEKFWELSGFFTLSLLLGYLSLLTPAGFGVREGIIVAGLSKFTNLAHGTFLALFTRIMLIISELIFIFCCLVLYKSKSSFIDKIYNLAANHKQKAILVGLIMLYTIYFSWISFLRYDNFYTGRFDLGNMAQTVWNTTQGRIFEFSNPDGVNVVSRLAFHADFILILLAPIYALFPSPKTLLFIQALIVALGGIFVYLIAKDKLKNKNFSLLFAFLYLVNPSVQRANLYDFHAVTLATTFLLGTYYFYSKKRYVWFLVFAVFAAICKEQIWLIIALFGILILFKQKKRIFGSMIFVLSLGIFYYLISHAIPNSLGSEHFAMSYYSEFGDDSLSIAKNILLSPQKVIEIVWQKEKIDYLRQLFSPLGYLPFIYPFFLILAGGDLAINLLSNNAQLHQIYYQYTAAITPFIFISAIFGASVLIKYINKKYVFLLYGYILIAGLISAYELGPLPGAKDANLDMITKQINDRKFINRKLSQIPPDLSVASSNNVGSHLSHRRHLYTLPIGINEADIIIFFPTIQEQPDSLAAQKVQLNQMRTNPNYVIDTEKGLFVIFKKKNI